MYVNINSMNINMCYADFLKIEANYMDMYLSQFKMTIWVVIFNF